MIEFRCFRNDDPPRLADVWRSAELGPSAMQPMTSALLEAAVFSKPYFDREGLIVAVDGERTVGFAHAGFGPTADRHGIDPRIGTTLLVVVVPHAEHEAIGDGLLKRTESFLRGRGATTLLGGGSSAMRSFYLGLYGGSDLPGILDSSPAMQAVFRRAGYGVAERIAVVRRRLSGFRPPVNRLQLAIRRNTVMRVIDEPGRRTWWEAATTTGIALRRYELRNQAEELLGAASFWDMQPLSSAWGVTAAGLMHVDIVGPRRRQGLAKYLVAEAMHDLADEGVSLVEAHVSDANTAAMKLFEALGFEAVEYGAIFRRDAV
ncbi:MAG: GNAT family N-acetyltransferase [Planctomycetia bacterium]